jgi:hypothetical protein
MGGRGRDQGAFGGGRHGGARHNAGCAAHAHGGAGGTGAKRRNDKPPARTTNLRVKKTNRFVTFPKGSLFCAAQRRAWRGGEQPERRPAYLGGDPAVASPQTRHPTRQTKTRRTETRPRPGAPFPRALFRWRWRSCSLHTVPRVALPTAPGGLRFITPPTIAGPHGTGPSTDSWRSWSSWRHMA